MEQEFVKWVASIKKRYKQSQIKAAIRVNSELIAFYFDLGKEISESSFKKQYGNSFFKKLSDELKKNASNTAGFSIENLRYVEKFYTMYKNISPQVVGILENGSNYQISPQVVAKLSMVPWGHHRFIIDKCKNDERKAWFYINKIIENGWSRSTLDLYISSNLYEREGKAITNFEVTLPKEESDHIQQLTKDPYCFDFFEARDDYNEKEIKDTLVRNIKRVLLELGKGFAFVGQEYRIIVGESEFYIDLLFYNIPLHSYVVIEVKSTKFKPEYLGQLGLYVSAVNHNIKSDKDGKTIGLLFCKDKDNLVAQYSLENFSIPLGISSFELSKLLPEEYKNSLPTIEELEAELKTK